MKTTAQLIADAQRVQGEIESVKSGLRYYDRSASPIDTGEDKLPALRAELARIHKALGWPAPTV